MSDKNVIEWAESRMQALTIWDVAVVKWSALLLGIAVGVKAGRRLERSVGPIAAAGAALAGWTVYRWFTARRD